MDSFRAEDLSTEKEHIVLNLFSNVKNQVILTTTLKKEEANKYDKFPEINVIDYTNHKTNKLLSKNYLKDFKKLLTNLNIEL